MDLGFGETNSKIEGNTVCPSGLIARLPLTDTLSFAPMGK
jgi:hypothetical protein